MGAGQRWLGCVAEASPRELVGWVVGKNKRSVSGLCHVRDEQYGRQNFKMVLMNPAPTPSVYAIQNL